MCMGEYACVSIRVYLCVYLCVCICMYACVYVLMYVYVPYSTYIVWIINLANFLDGYNKQNLMPLTFCNLINE